LEARYLERTDGSSENCGSDLQPHAHPWHDGNNGSEYFPERLRQLPVACDCEPSGRDGDPGYDTPEKADKLIEDSKALIAKYKADGVAVPQAPVKALSAPITSGSAKSQADERLRAELAALASKDSAEAAAASETKVAE